jgi:hypothetical protein
MKPTAEPGHHVHVRRPTGRLVTLLAATGVAVALVAVANPGSLGDPATGPSASVARSPTGSPLPSPSASPDLASPDAVPSPSATPSTGGDDYLLIPKAELQALPTSGAAWDYLVRIAHQRWPAPDINDQDSQTDTLALAAALVYARTGDPAMRAKARDAVMAVIPTFKRSNLEPGLGPLRQTAGWVLTADFIELDGEDDHAFRAFLERLLTQPTGRHSRWNHVVGTHDDSPNNWGAWAGAARIAASLYLRRDLNEAEETFRGFLGSRNAWSRFFGQTEPLPPAAAAWACYPAPRRFTPVNRDCRRSGIDLDGAVPLDISRGSAALQWPPAPNGIMYTLETLAGYSLQAELLYQNGFPDAWEVQDEALRRMADVVSRSDAAGGPGWNPGRVQLHIPWLLNHRYGTDYPTVPAEYGRSLGYTDWLYGS